jgi:hypothetical protein
LHWVAKAHGTCLQVTHRDCTRTKHCACADPDVWPYKGISTNPRIVTYKNGRFDQWSIGAPPVMGACTQMYVLRDGHPRANVNRPQCIQNYAVSDSGLITDAQMPRHRDLCGGVYMDLRADPCAEHA